MQHTLLMSSVIDEEMMRLRHSLEFFICFVRNNI